MGDDADLAALGFQNRALFDVIFKHRMHGTAADIFGAAPADAVQLVAEALALGILAGVGVVFVWTPA